MAELWISDLGQVPYGEALALQHELRAARQAGAIPDVLALLEHPPVYTRGRRTREGELPLGDDFYAAQGIEIVDVRRGGRVTYHGPGQLVGYTIVAIDDVVGFVRLLEQALVAALAGFGVQAHARPQDGPDYTGVWVGEDKIASIGLHVSRGVTTHGFAINADNSLEPFAWVVPCGLPDVRMTSLGALTGRSGTLPALRAGVADAFVALHQAAPARWVDPADLRGAVAGRETAASRE
jgi:lipoyl(octanoyl) transferase